MIVIVMGPMGSGKTHIGELLATALGWPFIEGDAFHPPENVEKMRAGRPLTDADRAPWLASVRREIDQRIASGGHAVLACSALKQTYRDTLGVDQQTVRTVYLRGSRDVLLKHLAARNHPYMADQLLQSQLDTLEEPADGITVDIAQPPQEIVKAVLAGLEGSQ